MSQLIQLRRKIKSIRTTKKITYAMRLVSMSFYARLEKGHTPLTHYKDNVESIFTDLSHYAEGWENSVLFPKDILDSTPLFVIVTSSKGLCGTFNSNLKRYFKQQYFVEEHQQPVFVTVGSKAASFAKEESLTVVKSFAELTLNNFSYIADDFVEFIADEKNTFSSIRFFSSYFKNFFVQKPHITQVTPLKRENEDFYTSNAPHLEQDIKTIMDFLAIRYLKSSMLNILFQSILAEQAARFLAMDNATTSANKLIDTLTLRYNKARQALITRELAELSASFGKFGD